MQRRQRSRGSGSLRYADAVGRDACLRRIGRGARGDERSDRNEQRRVASGRPPAVVPSLERGGCERPGGELYRRAQHRARGARGALHLHLRRRGASSDGHAAGRLGVHAQRRPLHLHPRGRRVPPAARVVERDLGALRGGGRLDSPGRDARVALVLLLRGRRQCDGPQPRRAAGGLQQGG